MFCHCVLEYSYKLTWVESGEGGLNAVFFCARGAWLEERERRGPGPGGVHSDDYYTAIVKGGVYIPCDALLI